MARHQRMPTQEAGYTYAVVPCLPSQIVCNEEESIYERSVKFLIGHIGKRSEEPHNLFLKIVGFLGKGHLFAIYS